MFYLHSCSYRALRPIDKIASFNVAISGIPRNHTCIGLLVVMTLMFYGGMAQQLSEERVRAGPKVAQVVLKDVESHTTYTLPPPPPAIYTLLSVLSG